MIQERSVEYEYLRDFYNREENQILVLYGNRYNGAKEFVRDFLEGLDHFYYLARQCSAQEQVNQWKGELKEELPKGTVLGDDLEGLLSAMLNQKCVKRVIVIDEFQNIVRSNPDFIETLLRIAADKWNNQPVLFLLVSENSFWVENQMVEKLGSSAYDIAGLLKLNELKFLEIVRHFKNYELTDCVEAYSILGGFKEFWEEFSDEKTIPENVCDSILKKGTLLYEHGLNIYPEELREPAVYNTLLSALSSGREKLNDIYKYTGFSRAKISVYLKNLIAQGIVRKVNSYDTACRENAQKGIYRISDPFTEFWFKFVFPHLSRLGDLSSEAFYQKYIAPELLKYTARYFIEVCSEYLELMNRMGRLSFRYTKKGSWIGKVGNIDIIAQDEEGQTLVAMCSYEKEQMSYEDYEWFMFCVKQAKLTVNDYFLFSAGTFDEQIIEEAAANENIYLIDALKL
ncbi:MAG: ATP-binding protein [Lachnospiraceae bacterium]|nr:ATP-binding protein [Lachnospiraceae bacterium]